VGEVTALLGSSRAHNVTSTVGDDHLERPVLRGVPRVG
jgi:hypothetical protein